MKNVTLLYDKNWSRHEALKITLQIMLNVVWREIHESDTACIESALDWSKIMKITTHSFRPWKRKTLSVKTSLRQK